VKGNIIFTTTHLKFEPVQCEENQTIKEQLHNYEAMIDFRDIVDTEIINLINEKAIMHENDYIKEAYKYDFLIQINLSKINGQSLKSESSTRKVVANVFLKFAFLDMDGMILTNDSQKKIVSAINEKIHDYMNFAAVEDGHSLTYVPYFDATLAD
jgi:hypothetical protein